ncbi:extracellular catalytic domain type 1 short-chain-length polyhydroxyalkanoate depolymerase [Nannocystis punicea]|uniref:PHB depolymerase family esterase n=1 Tax=Nannocystis punicea TaxID=2995304 RepID=A0ABY7H5I9_9BACT|nr:PHB depolymerase family esterase [Nannocystis poenicansa]WAS94551.1 PHB depolymerase family esterase [Nannocystis poenicansa]
MHRFAPLFITAAAVGMFLGPAPAAADGVWSSRTVAGMTTYVYTPSTAGVVGEGRSLLIALHGCAQSATVFRDLGNWAAAAEAYGMVVAVPGAPNGGVLLGCWDYFGGNHTRTQGHAGALLQLAANLTADQALDVDPAQVYVAGLSSGGGMAMVMGCVAPDVFAGVGIDAGPSVGTSSSQIGSVSTSQQAASSLCTNLAGTHAGSFSTQLTSVLAGTNDYVVAQGYADLNAKVMAQLYGAAPAGGFSVADLEGYQPSGTGSLWADADGPRVSQIRATGLAHAWPTGSGSGADKSYVSPKHVNYAWYLADFFTTNNRRVCPDCGGNSDTGNGETGGETGNGETGGETGNGETGGETGNGETGSDDTGNADTGGGDTGVEPCTPSTPYVQVVTATITGHLSRFASYPHGYGTADATYTSLFAKYGMSTAFPLYQGTDGKWYADPAKVPGAVSCP